jgi:hypothetical protein
MYESSISLIELLDFKISQLHVPHVRFLDFKNNIVLYFTQSLEVSKIKKNKKNIETFWSSIINNISDCDILL